MAIDSGIKGIKPPRSHPIPGYDDLRSSYDWNPHTSPSNVILRLSKSAYTTWLFCEQQHFIKYVLGVKEITNDNMTRGTNVHDVVEDFYDGLDVKLASDQAELYGFHGLNELFRAHIPTESKRKEWDGEVTEPKPFTLGEEDHLKRYMRDEAKRFMSCDSEHFIPVVNEDSFDAVVDVEVNGQVVLVHLTGIIDRMFSDEQGNLHIHELKTGLWKHTDGKLESMQKEMAFYVYLLRKSKDPSLGGQTCTYWGWDHTKGVENHSGEIYRFIENVRTSTIQKMLKDMKMIVATHLGYTGNFDGKRWGVKAGSFATERICEPWCAVKGFCPKYERVLMPHDMKEMMENE